ncbi:hypothetical protein TWF281_002386 [Arthrobotrys megalospora]
MKPSKTLRLPARAAVTNLPTEVLLSILELLDRKILLVLRLVDRHFHQIATSIVFKDFSVHYGFKQSVPQMEAIIKSTELQSCIRSLYLPSESFFPIAKNFSLENSKGVYRLPWFREPHFHEPPAHPSYLEQEGPSVNVSQSSSFNDAFFEVPTRRQMKFTLSIEGFKIETGIYTQTLFDFLRACPRLRDIHITTGFGFDAERMKFWSSMIGSEVFPILAECGIEKLEISVASVDCLHKMLTNYDPKSMIPGTVFQSVTSLIIRIQNPIEKWYLESRLVPVDWDHVSQFRHRLYRFLSCMPNLTFYSAGNSDIMRPAIEIVPVPPECQRLTSLNLSFINFTKRVFQDFQELMKSPPPITKFTLDTGTIWASTLLQETYPREHQDWVSPACRLPSWSFETVPFTAGKVNMDTDTYSCSFEQTWAEINWANMFAVFRKGFPKLTSFTFKRLLYSTTYGVLLVPIQDREDYNRTAFRDFVKGTWDMELISVFENDFLALEAFRREVNERRRGLGLRDLEGDPLVKDDKNLFSLSGLPHRTKNKRVVRLVAHNIWDEYGIHFGDDVYCFW